MLQRKEILSMNPVSSAVAGIDQYGKDLIAQSLPSPPLPSNSKQLLSLGFLYSVIVCQETKICRPKLQAKS